MGQEKLSLFSLFSSFFARSAVACRSVSFMSRVSGTMTSSKIPNPSITKFHCFVDTFDQAKSSLVKLSNNPTRCKHHHKEGDPNKAKSQAIQVNKEQDVMRQVKGHGVNPPKRSSREKISSLACASAVVGQITCCQTAHALPTSHMKLAERKGTPNWHAQEPLLTTHHPNKGKTKGSCQVN